jgi:uncharacterized membrane protein YdjX (TVP38/TMEM64 family)
MTNIPPPNREEHPSDQPKSRGDKADARRNSKLLLFLALLSAAVILWITLGDFVSLEYLSTKEAELRSFQSEHVLLVYGAAFIVYVVMAGLSIPGAAAISLLYAWYFGFWRGVILVSFASTAGATVAFLLSRHLFRDAALARFGSRLNTFRERLEQDGAFYLLWLRLVPLVPFFVINLVMGLTPLRTRTFWWVSQLGMLPGTVVYVYAGSRVPSLSELSKNGISSVLSPWQLTQLAIAFGLLGAFPLIAKHLLGRRASRTI